VSEQIPDKWMPMGGSRFAYLSHITFSLSSALAGITFTEYYLSVTHFTTLLPREIFRSLMTNYSLAIAIRMGNRQIFSKRFASYRTPFCSRKIIVNGIEGKLCDGIGPAASTKLSRSVSHFYNRRN
jgi:hypothetical protein